ncbi:hypothetical protein BGZ83_006825 [Gryganskiella cystojenkinii]|nr:hypothetical protein BGZ83_006825 [Gryganskiella cystojenkinii]
MSLSFFRVYKTNRTTPHWPDYFNSTTLPYLYNTVFARTSSKTIDQGSLVIACPELVKLIQMLLRRRPRNAITQLLDAAYDVFSDSSAQDSPNKSAAISGKETYLIEYLRYVHHFDFEQAIFLPRYHTHIINWKYYPPRLTNFVFKTKTGELADRYGEGAQDRNLMFPPEIVQGSIHTQMLRYGALSVTLRRDLTWTLCAPVLEHIQSMIIPLSDIDRYLDSVERFQSLVSVIFKMDELLQSYELRQVLEDDDGQEEEEYDGEYDVRAIQRPLRHCLRDRNRQFRAMIAFVQRHTTLFRNQLFTAECPDNQTWPRTLRCPTEIQDAVMEPLPPLVRPTVIDNMNWRRIALQLKKTDLSLVKHYMPCGCCAEIDVAFQRLDPLLLKRCRSLRSLNMATSGRGSFLWAVEEKKAWNHCHSDHGRNVSSLFEPAPSLSSSYSLSYSSSSSFSPPLSLIPLERVLLGTTSTFTDELDDIVFGFGDTLKYLYAATTASISTTTPHDLRVGQNWRLPKLTTLKINLQTCRGQRLLVDPDFWALDLSEDLECISLVDIAERYHSRNIYSCRPMLTQLPKLTQITLQGWPALTFDPETLHSTPSLQDLQLRMSNRMDSFIPPLEDLMISFQDQDCLGSNISGTQFAASTKETESPIGQEHQQEAQQQSWHRRRPRWTWDWHLPNLISMDLRSEFAYLFQFRMLVNCPSLKKLTISIITSNSNSSQRRLSLQDFIVDPAIGSPSSTARLDHNDSQFIVVPSMKHLSFFGRWILDDDEVLEAMLGRTFRNVINVKVSEMSGFSLQAWVSTIRKLPKVKECSCGVATEEFLEAETLLALGLVRTPVERHNRVVDKTRPPIRDFRFSGEVWNLAEEIEKEKIQ